MLKKSSVALSVFLILALMFIPVLAKPAAQDQPLRIAVSLPDLAFPFFVHMQKQVEDEAAKLGVEVVILDGRGDTTKQTADLESVIAEQYDGLLISPLTADAMAPAVQAVIDAGIPVVTIDRNVAGDTALATLAHVGADNVKGGEAQGQWILENFPNGAKIFNLQGTPGATPAIDRNAGLKNVIDGKAEYEVVFEQTANFRRADGLSVTEAGLAAQDTPPDVIVAANDDMALGALEALKARDLVGKVAVLGFDALPEALLAVQNGELTGTVEQFPGGQSRTALNLLVDFLRNGTAPAQHDNYLTPVLMTAANLSEAERIGEIGG